MSSLKFPTQPQVQSAKPRVDRERIAQEAFQIWQSEGCPEGRAEIHWRMAEERLSAQSAGRPTNERPAVAPAAPARRGNAKLGTTSINT